MAHSDVINEIMYKSEYLNNYLSNAINHINKNKILNSKIYIKNFLFTQLLSKI